MVGTSSPLDLKMASGPQRQEHSGGPEAIFKSNEQAARSEGPERLPLINLLSEIVLEGRGRKWAMVEERCFGIGACIELQEAKTEARARFGLYESGFALSLDLDRAPLIGRVRDAFWAHVLTLGGLGQLTYDPMAMPQALCSGRSTTVPVRPGYAINELMKYWHLLKQEGDSLIDFGCLSVSWPLDTPVHALLPAMAGTLDSFYRISYELYRLDKPSRTGEGKT